MTKFWAKKIYKIDISEQSPEKSLKNISVPVLIIHAENDDVIPSKNAHLLYDAANEPKELWIVPKATHGEAYFMARKEYEEKVLGFFGEYLK